MTALLALFHRLHPVFARILAAAAAVAVVLSTANLCGAESEEALAKARERLHREQPEVFAPVADDPALPRVLLIGDSISIGYTLPVRERLRGVANVHRAFENCSDTWRGLQQLDTWLDGGRWDVIHFNFGLHDLSHRTGGPPNASLSEYEANLRKLVTRLRATGAKLIFATTTPVVGTMKFPVRYSREVPQYNDVARRVMAGMGVSVDDLFAFVEPHVSQWQIPGDVHFTSEGYAALAGPVAASIRAELDQRGQRPGTKGGGAETGGKGLGTVGAERAGRYGLLEAHVATSTS